MVITPLGHRRPAKQAEERGTAAYGGCDAFTGGWGDGFAVRGFNSVGYVAVSRRERKRNCEWCSYSKDQHEPECPNRGRINRCVQITAFGQRQAFIQSLERILGHPLP